MMPKRDEKRAATTDDVLAAFALPDRLRFRTRPSLLHTVVSRVWGVPNVYSSGMAIEHIQGAAFERLVTQMVKDGQLVRMDGWDLEQLLADISEVTRTRHYYMLPQGAEELRKEAADREAEALRVQADQYARGFLVERHRTEYEALMTEFYTEHEKEQGK